MTDAETMVLASVQVLIADGNNPKPVAFGSGFIIRYLGRRFFVSVSHVTDHEGLTTFLETNLPLDERGPILQTISGICYFDILTVDKNNLPGDFEKFLKKGKRKRLDISFAEVTYDIPLLQPEMDFGIFALPYSKKIELDMDHIAIPEQGERYGFYGKIRPRYSGNVLTMTPTLKHSLKYHRSNSDFHIFLSPEIIKTPEDYAGCSGAPILDSQQRLVAVPCIVVTPSKIIYGFPIYKCKELIDSAIATHML